MTPEEFDNAVFASLTRILNTQYFTVSSAARKLGVCRNTMYKLIETGKIRQTERGISMIELVNYQNNGKA